MDEIKQDQTIKRFATYELSLDYFLACIKFNATLANEAPLRMRGYKIPQNVRYIYEMFGSTPLWSNFDAEIRLINEKKSKLPSMKRQMIMEIFEFVHHFVAQEGEEITKDREFIDEVRIAGYDYYKNLFDRIDHPEKYKQAKVEKVETDEEVEAYLDKLEDDNQNRV